MGEMTMGAGEFKATCLKLMDAVAETGATYTITKRGKPVAKLVPVTADAMRKPIYGLLKDSLRIVGALSKPLAGYDYDPVRKFQRLEAESDARVAARKKGRLKK